MWSDVWLQERLAKQHDFYQRAHDTKWFDVLVGGGESPRIYMTRSYDASKANYELNRLLMYNDTINTLNCRYDQNITSACFSFSLTRVFMLEICFSQYLSDDGWVHPSRVTPYTGSLIGWNEYKAHWIGCGKEFRARQVWNSGFIDVIEVRWLTLRPKYAMYCVICDFTILTRALPIYACLYDKILFCIYIKNQLMLDSLRQLYYH